MASRDIENGGARPDVKHGGLMRDADVERSAALNYDTKRTAWLVTAGLIWALLAAGGLTFIIATDISIDLHIIAIILWAGGLLFSLAAIVTHAVKSKDVPAISILHFVAIGLETASGAAFYADQGDSGIEDDDYLSAVVVSCAGLFFYLIWFIVWLALAWRDADDSAPVTRKSGVNDAELVRDNAELRRENAELRAAVKAAKDNQANSNQGKKDTDHLRASLTEAMTENRSLQHQLESARTSKHNHSGSNDDVARLSEQVASLSAKNSELSADSKELHNKLRQLEQTNKGLDAEVDNLKRKAAAAGAAAGAAAADDAADDAEIRRLKALVEEQEKVVEHHEAHCAQNLAAARAEIARVKSDAQAKIKNLQDEVHHLSDTVGELKGDNEMRKKLIADNKALLQSMKPQLGCQYQSGPPNGVLITGVTPDLPVALAGVREDDIVEQVDGIDTEDKPAFKAAVKGVVPGDEVPFQVMRDNDIMTIIVIVGSPGKTLEEVQRIKRLADGIVHDEDIEEAEKAAAGN